MIEQANRTIENMLSDFVNDTQQDWEEYIPLLMMGYRSSTHESLGASPNEMVFGRPIFLPVDLVLGVPDPEMIRQTFGSEFANQLANKLEIIHNFARNKIQLSTKHMIKEYSKRIHQHLY